MSDRTVLNGEKFCNRCKTRKPVERFYFIKGKGYYRAACYECEAAARKDRYADLAPEAKRKVLDGQAARAKRGRDWVWEQKSKPCERCGNSYHPTAMQFDHVPGRGEKLFEVASRAGGRSRKDLLAEIAKCQLLCANCHHITTWERKTGNTVPLDWTPDTNTDHVM